MTTISTKSVGLNIAKMDVYDKVSIGLLGVWICTGSLLGYQILEINKRRDKIWSDEVGKKKPQTMNYVRRCILL